MKNVTITLQRNEKKKTQYTFDGRSWSCIKDGEEIASRCSGMKISRFGDVPPGAERDLDEMIYYAENVWEKARRDGERQARRERSKREAGRT